jgi:Ras-related protein Rab-1A
MAILGDSSVGKSSILLRFSDNVFLESWLPTIGVDFKIRSLEVNKKSVKCQIWDTAGQERFKNIVKTYYKGCKGFILVYDISYRQSFENIENWLKDIENFADKDTIKILVGNKCDLETKREVSYECGERLAK